MDLEEIKKRIEELFYKKPSKNDKIVGYTGKGGAIIMQEMLLGREMTEEEKDEVPDGVWDISNGLKYLGKYK